MGQCWARFCCCCSREPQTTDAPLLNGSKDGTPSSASATPVRSSKEVAGISELVRSVEDEGKEVQEMQVVVAEQPDEQPTPQLVHKGESEQTSTADTASEEPQVLLRNSGARKSGTYKRNSAARQSWRLVPTDKTASTISSDGGTTESGETKVAPPTGSDEVAMSFGETTPTGDKVELENIRNVTLVSEDIIEGEAISQEGEESVTTTTLTITSTGQSSNAPPPQLTLTAQGEITPTPTDQPNEPDNS